MDGRYLEVTRTRDGFNPNGLKEGFYDQFQTIVGRTSSHLRSCTSIPKRMGEVRLGKFPISINRLQGFSRLLEKTLASLRVKGG